MQRLLFITPKIHERDDDFAFTSLWAQAFANAGFAVTVICLEKGETRLTMPIFSLGRERGWPIWRSFIEFQRIILTVPHDRVFVHMNPRWLAAGAWYWWLRHIPTYLWYTHYTRPFSLKVGDKRVKRFFAATAASLPQYNHDPRKVITGHGIDISFWDTPALSDAVREPATHLLAVHRISRSKRFDLVLKALMLLPSEYTLTHYGRALDPRTDPEYEAEIRGLMDDPRLRGRVRLMGSVPMPELRQVYPRFRTLINLVPDTIDKTVLEGMYCGLAPVITRGHAEAIGYPHAPADDEPETVAAFIASMPAVSRDELRKIVRDRHSLPALIEKMAVFIRSGT